MTQDHELDNDSFFEMEDEDIYEDDEVDNRSRWTSVGIVLLTVVVALILCVVGIRQLSEANQNAGFEDKSWVISGDFVDVTPDLQTNDNVAIYAGQAPADDQFNGVIYKSNLSDAKEIQAGEKIQFRGTQTGAVADDFDKEVDALIAKTGDNQVEVVRTGEKDSLKPVTASLVTRQQVMGWVSLIGAVLVFAGGVWGAVFFNRRSRGEEDYE